MKLVIFSKRIVYISIFVLIVYMPIVNAKLINNKEAFVEEIDKCSQEIMDITTIISRENNKFIANILSLLDLVLPNKYKEPCKDGENLSELNSKALTMMQDVVTDNKALINGLIEGYESKVNQGLEKNDNDAEGYHFIPKEPKQLTDEEKLMPIKERIAKKYIGEIPSQIQDIIFYFSNHTNCLKNNLRLHNRLLLHGKPGTGKSHLVKVIAQELQIPLLIFTASFFSDKYFGESSRRIRKAFEIARTYGKPLFMFIDELDALAAKRTKDTNIEHRATLLTLLTEMQDLQDHENVFVFAATNDLKVLDIAIKDRFAGAICEIKELSVQQRAQLFKKVFADRSIQISSKLAQRLAEVTTRSIFAKDNECFSNRDIEYIVSTALIKHFEAHTQDPNTCKHLCSYVRATMNAMGKKGRFALIKPTYSDGI